MDSRAMLGQRLTEVRLTARLVRARQLTNVTNTVIRTSLPTAVACIRYLIARAFPLSATYLQATC